MNIYIHVYIYIYTHMNKLDIYMQILALVTGQEC